MLDQAIRARLAPRLDRAAARLAPTGISRQRSPRWACSPELGRASRPPPLRGTRRSSCGWATGCSTVSTGRWLAAAATELRGLLDFVADFVVYSGFVVGVAIADPAARLACVVLLATYLVNNVALLSFSSMIERLGLSFGDERSLRLTTGLAEGTETIVVYTLFCLLPGASEAIAWAFAGLVALTAVQRVAHAVRTLPRRSVLDPQAPSASRQSDA